MSLGGAVAIAALVVPLSVAEAEGGSGEGSGKTRARAAIVFVSGPPPGVDPTMIQRLSRHPQLALGFASSIMGSYTPEQSLLDFSSGSRTWTSLYKGDLPAQMGLAQTRDGWKIRGWARARGRSRTPPADVAPGSLASAARAAGRTVAYVGPRGTQNREAIVAADADGRVASVSLERPERLERSAVRLWRHADLLVARLPAGRDGSGALSGLLRARRAGDLLLAVQLPTSRARRMLAVGAAGLGQGRDVWSQSTRTDGLVVATDVVPTVLKRLGAGVPEQVTGEPIEARGNRDVGDLEELKDRLSEVGPRRWPIVLGALGGSILLAAMAAAGSKSRRGALVLRTTFLAALWIPSILLLTGALAPSWGLELALVAGLSTALALACDRLLAWPVAILLPATVTVLGHLVDLAFGSTLIVRSLLGPNPILGARFYGIGNELEVTLVVAALLGIGTAMARARPATVARGFALGGGALAFLFGWGKLGADVGASIIFGAGAAAAAVYVLERRSLRWRLAVITGAPVIALGALAALDLATGGNAHFTRSVLRAGGLHGLAEVAQRRLELSYHSLRGGVTELLVATAVVIFLIGVRYRRQILLPLSSSAGVRAGLVGAAVAVVVGALSNDSGPIIFLIGTVYLLLFVGYLQSMPKMSARVPFHVRARDPRW